MTRKNEFPDFPYLHQFSQVTALGQYFRIVASIGIHDNRIYITRHNNRNNSNRGNLWAPLKLINSIFICISRTVLWGESESMSYCCIEWILQIFSGCSDRKFVTQIQAPYVIFVMILTKSATRLQLNSLTTFIAAKNHMYSYLFSGTFQGIFQHWKREFLSDA